MRLAQMEEVYKMFADEVFKHFGVSGDNVEIQVLDKTQRKTNKAGFFRVVRDTGNPVIVVYDFGDSYKDITFAHELAHCVTYLKGFKLAHDWTFKFHCKAINKMFGTTKCHCSLSCSYNCDRFGQVANMRD